MLKHGEETHDITLNVDCPVGDQVGVFNGQCVGSTVEKIDGTAVGASEAAKDGSSEGRAVVAVKEGATVEMEDGILLGEEVGISVVGEAGGCG